MLINKNQLFYTKFIYREAPQINKSELSVLEHKKEIGETAQLSVDDFVNKANDVFKQYAENLSVLPDDVRASIRSNLVSYFLNAADSFDRDAEKGLDRNEFRVYKDAMIAKMISVLQKYAPSREQIAAQKRIIEQKKESADRLKTVVDRMDRLQGESLNFNPQNLHTPDGIQKEMELLHYHNAKLAEDSNKVVSDLQTAQQEFANYQNLSNFQKANQGISYLFNNVIAWATAGSQDSDRFEANATVSSVNTAVNKLRDPEILKPLKDKEEKITKYGAVMIRAGQLLREEFETARSHAIATAENDPTRTEENKEKYEFYKKIKEDLIGQRRNLAEERNVFLQEMVKKRVHANEEMHTKANKTLDETRNRIANMLNQPNLPDEEKQRLTEAIKDIEDRKQGMQSEIRLVEFDLRNPMPLKKQFVDSYVDNAFNPAISEVDALIRHFELKQFENGNSLEKIQSQFGQMINGIDGLNNALNETIMNLNITNTIMIGSLENNIKSLNNVERLGLYQSMMYSFGGVAKLMFKDTIADNLNNWANKLHKIGGPLKLVGGVLNIVGGVSEGVGEMTDGLATVAAAPREAAKGFGALIGRDPLTGKWSRETAGTAWREFGAAMVSAEEFSKGSYGRGIGKTLLNIALTVTGAGAIAKGVQFAKIAAPLRFAGQTRLQYLARMSAEFAKGTAKGTAEGFYNLGSKTLNAAGYILTGKIIYRPLIALGKGLQHIATEAAWVRQIARHEGLRAALGSTEFYQTLSRIKEGYKARRDIKKELRDQTRYQENIIRDADDATRFERKLAEAQNDRWAKNRTLEDLKRTEPRLYSAWERYQQNSALLEDARHSLQVKMVGSELANYQTTIRNLGSYTDDIGQHGDLTKMLKEYGINADGMSRGDAIKKLTELAKGPDKMRADYWLAMHERFGQRPDQILKLQSEIKNMRTEGYINHQDMIDAARRTNPREAEIGADLLRQLENAKRRTGPNAAENTSRIQARLQEWSTKNQNLLNTSEYKILSETRLKTKLDELLQTSGVNIKNELALMDSTLYFQAGGVNRWNFNTLRANDYRGIQNSLNNHIDQFARGQYAQLSRSDITMIKNQINDVLATAKEAGITGHALKMLLNDSTNKLVYQTIHSAKRQLGDHGIRHVAGNIRANLEAMRQHAEQAGLSFSAKDKLEIMIGHIGHDMGYTSSVALRSFSTTGAHPMISTSFMLKDRSMTPIFKQILGEDSFNRVTRAVLNHDGVEWLPVFDAAKINALRSTMNPQQFQAFMQQQKYNAMMNSMKIADNLALFAFDKLPPIFYRDPVCLQLLGSIEFASSSGNQFLIYSLKGQMKSRILNLQRRGRITGLEAEGFMSAIDEINAAKSAESTLGMLAGQHGYEVISLMPEPQTGRLIPHMRLEGSPVFGDIENALNAVKKTGATAAESIQATARFDGATQQFMKILEDYAKKNNCSIQISGREIFKNGNLTADGLTYLRNAIKNNQELRLIQGNQTFMTVGLQTSARSLSGLENAYSTATNYQQRAGIARTAIRETERKIANIDDSISRASINDKGRLQRERQGMQMELQRMQNMETANEILKDAGILRRLKAIREFKEAFRSSNLDKTFANTRDLLERTRELFSVRERRQIERILNNNNINHLEKAQQAASVIERLDTRLSNSLFVKYKIENPISRENIMRYIQIGAATATGATFVYTASRP